MINMKNFIKYIMVGIFSFGTFTFNVLASNIDVENDLESTYIPTTIINGSFSEEPWMNYKLGQNLYEYCRHEAIVQEANEIYFNGVNKGWNTTETTVWNGNLFEYSSDSFNLHSVVPYNGSINPSEKFVEMNGSHSAILYQDLTTQGNDVILWRLKHAVTTANANADAIQSMRVEIGAPNMNGADIVNAHGMDNNINPEIELSTKAVYRSTGVTNSSGEISTLGYAGSDIGNLSLSKTANASGWYKASGIYIVPENQNVTRFGFIAEANKANYGNLLDDIEFSTLIGNLNAVYNDDKSATVTGYWGETDPSKKLIIKIGENIYELDMSAISGNFKFDITKEEIGKETYIEVYHEDFSQVKKVVKIVAGKVTKKTTSEDGNIQITSDDETIINSFDEETTNKIKHGEDIDLSLDIRIITDTIEKEQKDLFINHLEGYNLGEIYNVSLYKKLESDEDSIQVTELKEPLEFTISIPQNLINKKVNRSYKILNNLNGEFELIDAIFNKETNTLTFKTNKLSQLAIVYKDLNNPNTGDSLYLYFGLAITSLLGCIFVISRIQKSKRK